MSLYEQDIISFQHSGSSVRYDETFYSSFDKYSVTLSEVKSTHNTQAKDILCTPLNPAETVKFNLTISCKKKSQKCVKINVYEVGTEKILFQKNFSVPNPSKRVTSLITVKNKPAIYVISVVTCKDITEMRRIVSLLELEESNCEKQELETFSKDLEKLLEKNTLSDVVLTDGENKMELNKLILSARSSVFERMFQCPMKESLEGLVTITDIPFDVLKSLVTYMYSGFVNIESTDMARELYIAADKYNVQNLKDFCLSKLRPLKLDDVLDNLILADMYDEIALKEEALNFIDDYYSVIHQQKRWRELHLNLVIIIIFRSAEFERELYVNACIYDRENLKKYALSRLRRFKLKDVLDTLIFAEMHDEAVIKREAVNFIANNYSIFKQHEEWNKFKVEHLNLFSEIIILKDMLDTKLKK